MTLSINKVTTAGIREWDKIWHNCDYATYFHSREWAEIWQNYTNQKMKPDPRLILFSDGKKVILPFSVSKSFKGILRNYISSPAGTFGGWIAEDQLSIEHSQILVDYICKQGDRLTWRLNPYDEVLHQCNFDKVLLKNDETHAIDLSCGFDAVYKKWAKGRSALARKARKARKAGISVRIADSQQDWDGYYKIYEDSLRRWGESASSVYHWSLFNEIFQLDSPNIKLWLAVYEEKTVAGALCFYTKKHVAYWHGSALAKYFDLRPVNLLMFEIIKDACEKGYQFFDFNPSGGHEGVKNFKKSFGAVPLICPVVRKVNNTSKLLSKVKNIFSVERENNE
ncbi:MAG: methicillin resistance protein [Deltaproteobacteria bacterium]|nr:MAG: methicillin resistance protein [Deltaproteobacteria bacterium]